MIGVIAFFALIGPVQHHPQDRITQAEFMAYLVKEAACPGEIKNPVSLHNAKHVDLTHDGRDNVIVIASTCNTGTAGPDVHSVISRDTDGNLVELPIENQDEPRGTHPILFGNANYDLFAEKGELVKDCGDTSGREHPLVIRYRWDGHQFREVERKAAGTFRTSYDCSATTREVEQEICAVQTLARLDVDLNAAYVNTLRKLGPEAKLKLRSDQRDWLKKRDYCANFNDWVECLTNAYTSRIKGMQSY